MFRDVLLQYWRDYSVTLNYYMFHDFFYEIAKLYPEEIASMPRRNRLEPLMLMQRKGFEMTDEGLRLVDEGWVKDLTKQVCFHKLCWRN